MIKILTIFSLLVLGSMIVNAQNWLPINPADTYHYAIDTVSYPSHTIWVDSVKSFPDRTEYYLNKIVDECDTCIYSFSKIANQPQFLQKKQVEYHTGWIELSGPQSFWFKPHAAYNDIWIFDSANLVIAKVIELKTLTLFGQTDSIKIIQLSGNDTIIFSKNMGIISFPEFQSHFNKYLLIGIESRSVGVKSPDAGDIYNFEIGDRFQYDVNNGSGSYHYYGIKNFVITDKQINGEEISYMMEGYFIRHGFDDIHGYIDDVVTINQVKKINKKHLSLTYDFNKDKYFNHQLIEIHGGSELVIMHYSIQNDQFIMEVYGRDGYGGGSIQWLNYKNKDTLFPFGMYQRYYYKYINGLGCVEEIFELGEGFIREKLTGYIKDGDTVGTINPYNLSIPLNTDNLSPTIYPNPATDKILIQIPIEAHQDSYYEIVDFTGKTIDSGKIPEFSNEIDIKSLKSGIYLLRYKNDNQVFTVKFVKN